ncbi:MAG: hypothetical protein JO069_00580 [Verrucomicrobia bacterium]|nr:hypothetical protein [Verrucomicrobiota bacterium]
MTSIFLRSTCAVLAASVLLTGCEDMSPTTAGVLSGLAGGALAGGIAKAAGASNSTAIAAGMAAGAAIGAAVYIIAKHQATERQRRVAEERARLAYERMSAERKARVRKRRYIAVSTVRESNAVGQKSVMVFDTQNQQVVGNNVYDVKNAPRDGQVSKFDTYTAEYVGSGS